jgi:mycoredoxin
MQNTSGSVDQYVTPTATDQPIMYTTTWCGYCRRLKSQLDRAGISVKEIDIERHPGAAAVVERANGGNRTVPTVVFADGTALTNPSVRQVSARLS